jgi:hypothetical protein
MFGSSRRVFNFDEGFANSGEESTRVIVFYGSSQISSSAASISQHILTLSLAVSPQASVPTSWGAISNAAGGGVDTLVDRLRCTLDRHRECESI